MTTFKRTQMYFPEDLFREMKFLAEQEQSSVAELVRTAVREFLGKRKGKTWEDDPLWRMVGASESGVPDLAARHDDYLYAERR